jgi:hypothetical protein
MPFEDFPMASRQLSAEFLAALKCGFLAPLLGVIQSDDTLMLAIRDDCINIYYRGGNLLKIKRGVRSYSAHFDRQYFNEPEDSQLPRTLNSQGDAYLWFCAIPRLKEVMNRYFSTKRKSEREFQQLVAWENNRSRISNESEYFITDIEVADTEFRARIDMLGVRWLSHERQSAGVLLPVLIEMKYGKESLVGRSGLIEHLNAIEKILNSRSQSLRGVIEIQFKQLEELGLLTYKRSSRIHELRLSQGKPEVIILLANYNPRGSTLRSVLQDLQKIHYSQFELRFFVASYAGYGMHHASMLNTSDFLKLVSEPRGRWS